MARFVQGGRVPVFYGETKKSNAGTMASLVPALDLLSDLDLIAVFLSDQV